MVIYVIRGSCGGGGKTRSDSAEGNDRSSSTRYDGHDSPIRAWREAHHTPLGRNVYKQTTRKNHWRQCYRTPTETLKTRVKVSPWRSPTERCCQYPQNVGKPFERASSWYDATVVRSITTPSPRMVKDQKKYHDIWLLTTYNSQPNGVSLTKLLRLHQQRTNLAQTRQCRILPPQSYFGASCINTWSMKWTLNPIFEAQIFSV